MNTLTTQLGQLNNERLARPFKYNAELYDLGDPNYKLSAPIIIVVEEYPEEDSFIARFPPVDVFGEGETDYEALEDLKNTILDLFEELSDSDPNELGDTLKSHLNTLRLIINRA